MKINNQTTGPIERSENMADLEHKSAKQTGVLGLFGALIAVILLGIFYIVAKEEPRKQIARLAKNNVVGDNPGDIDFSLPDEPVVKEAEPIEAPAPKVIIPEPVVRPNVIKLKDIAKPQMIEEQSDPSYLRKLNAGGMLAGSVPKVSSPVTNIPESTVTKVKAGKLRKMNYLITQGTKIDCTMETALDSTIPGYTSCVTARDIYSTNGNVILLDRGTKIAGQYQSSLQQGQARLYVQWNRAVTPEGVTIELGSGGTGPLGRSGHEGWVDKKWWERFGNALMISILSDALGYAADQEGNDNFENTEATVNEFALIAAESGVDIQPTIHINQGASIIIYVQKDLDFSDVYSLDYDKNNEF